jgi:AraC family transcriptional regulator
MITDQAVRRRDDTLGHYQTAVERTITHMRANLNEPLDLAQLARVGALSKFHFLRVFTEMTQTTPGHFLSCLRIERAKELLAGTSASITQICLEVGYSSMGSFSHTFTQLVGLSPSDYRLLPSACPPTEFRGQVMRYLQSSAASDGATIAGTVENPGMANGVFFVGAFTTSVPQGVPESGTVLFAPGPFRLKRPALPNYHLLAALVRLPNGPIDLRQSLDVALVAHTPVAEDQADALPTLRLRALRPTDPPLVVALPALLRLG